MLKITDKTKIIERGGILCGRDRKIDLISECKGTRCNIETDPFKTCLQHSYDDTFGTFHTHPGKIKKTLPSIADLKSQQTHGQFLCIGAPKADNDRIICIKNKHLNKEDEIKRNKELDYMYKLERKIRTSSFYATLKERKEYDEKFSQIFSEKYYYKFDPSKCDERN